ncbi:lysis protein [Cronobacter dublinensis]
MLSRLLGITALIATLAAFYYHDQFTESQASLTEVNRELNAAKKANSQMLARQRSLEDLDARHTGELARAKDEIDRLRADVANGTRRLQLHATCKPVRNATGTTSLDDAAAPRPDDAAQWNYFTLRERIATITRQVYGLQDYIRVMRQQCPATDAQASQ